MFNWSQRGWGGIQAPICTGQGEAFVWASGAAAGVSTTSRLLATLGAG